MPLIIIAAGVALLLVLMIGFKVNGFIALVLVAAVVGFAEGMWGGNHFCTDRRRYEFIVKSTMARPAGEFGDFALRGEK